MTRFLIAAMTVALVMALALLSTGCPQRKDGAKTDTVLRIGAALPLTGPTSYYGQDSKRGIDLAIEEINVAGGVRGRRLEVVYEDTQGEGKLAVSAVQKLLSVNDVPAIIGCGTSTETLAVAPFVEQAKRVLISPVSSAAAVTTAGDYIFRSVPSDSRQARDLAEWIVESKVRKISLVFVNQTWGVGLKNDFVKEFESRGGKILSVTASDLDEKDFRTQLTGMRVQEPEAIVAIIYAKEGGTFVKQARELGLSEQIFGADPWTKQQFLDSAGKAAEGVLFTTPARYQGSEYQMFAAKYRTRYGKEPGIYDAHGYDCAKLIAKAITDGGTTGPEIQAAMAKIRGFQGATGETTFDSNGDVTTKGFARMTWSNGTIKETGAN